jgi:hypothetical protein
MGVVRGLREEGEGGEAQGNGMELLFRNAPCEGGDEDGGTFYHEGRKVPVEVMDGLRRVISSGVRMGIIENPKREMEMRARFRDLISTVERDLMEEGEGRGKEATEAHEDVMVWEGYADAARESLEEGKIMEEEGMERR